MLELRPIRSANSKLTIFVKIYSTLNAGILGPLHNGLANEGPSTSPLSLIQKKISLWLDLWHPHFYNYENQKERGLHLSFQLPLSKSINRKNKIAFDSKFDFSQILGQTENDYPQVLTLTIESILKIDQMWSMHPQL